MLIWFNNYDLINVWENVEFSELRFKNWIKPWVVFTEIQKKNFQVLVH